MREMMQLLGALGDVTLELCLVGAQLRLGVRDAVRHGVEGFGELIDLGRAAARGACSAVAAGEPPRGRGEAAHRYADAHRQHERDQQHQPQHRGGGVPERVLGLLGRGGGVLRRLQQAETRRHLQLLLHAHGEHGAVLAQAVPLRCALRVIALDLAPQARGLGKVLPHQSEPGLAGGALELRGVRVQHRREVALAPCGHLGCGDHAAHGVHSRRELGERAPCHHLRAVDGQSRAAGGGDALVDLVEGGLALRDPLRALRGATGELAGAGDVAGELQAQGGAARRDRW